MDPVTLIVTALAAGTAKALQERAPAAQALMRRLNAAGSATGKCQVMVHASQGEQVGGSQHPARHLCPASGC
jgi:hypothetical protein